MRSNIFKLYILNLLSGIVFWYPIEALFLQQIHVNPLGMSINSATFIIVQLLFDIPSGVLADKWKRKYVLFLAMLALALGSLLGGLSTDLGQYLVATVLISGFVVLTSGTFQAIMYDSLRDLDMPQQYDKHQGRAYALFLAGLGVSSLAGGYLSELFDYRFVYLATAVVMVVAGILVLTLKEPRAHKHVADRKLRQHALFSVKKIFASQLLMQLALLLSAMNVLRSTQNEFTGLFFIALGLSAIPIGYATALKWLTSSIGQLVAPKLGRKALRLAPAFFIVFTVFSLLPSLWSIPFFFLASFLYSVVANQAEAAVQDHTPSEIRATTLSVLSFASNVLLVPLALLFGWVANQSVFSAYFMIACIGLVYVVVWIFIGQRTLNKIDNERVVSQPPQSQSIE